MKRILILVAILFFPALVYIYFALGVPKVVKAPIYGPREVVQVPDKKSGEYKSDTVYHTIPAFSCLTTGGLVFDSRAKLDGRSYIAVFLPHPDSIQLMIKQLATDIGVNRRSYGYARFVFFMPTDTTGNVPMNAPDLAHDLHLGTDTGYTVFVTPAQFDSLRNEYYKPDPARKIDPWQTNTDVVLIDRLGRIRGYYNIRNAAELKKMKEDVNHILLRDEGVQTLEESKVEQKK
jgi:hypothetical protein